MKLLMIFSLIIVIYTWLGFPLFLLLLVKCFRKNLPSTATEVIPKEEILPTVSLIITVYNEDKVIRKRIENILTLDYPKEKLEIVVASDGSNDQTNKIVEPYAKREHIKLLPLERMGKSRSQNLTVKETAGEIIVFTDADTRFRADFLRTLVQGFSDPEIGCISGECHYINKDDSSTTQGVSFFWNFELFLRKLESRIGALFTASGACMAVRRSVFIPVLPECGEDDILPLDTLLQGYKVLHIEKAKAFVTNVVSPAEELKTRVRIVMRSLIAIIKKRKLLNPLTYPMISFAIVSHKILRWLTPIFLLAIVASNLFLLNILFFKGTFYLQLFFYGSSIIGFVLEKYHIRFSLFSLPFAFCVANVGFLIGVLKTLRGDAIIKYKA